MSILFSVPQENSAEELEYWFPHHERENKGKINIKILFNAELRGK